ncbi:MAG: GNAT family N-acetyltransferase [Aquisalimonadaceae bacterium]
MAEDAVEIARLVNAAYRPRPGTEGWTHESSLISGDRITVPQVRELLQQNVVLLGLHDGKIIACVQIQVKGREALIGMLAVEPGRQGSGVGNAMLVQAEAYAESSLGAEQFVLLVIRARTELVQYYLRRGYEDSGQRLDFPLGSGVGTPRGEALDLVMLRKHRKAPLDLIG